MLQTHPHFPDYHVPGLHGFDIIDSLFDPSALNAMRTEAFTLMPEAIGHNITVDGADEWRGGSPARRFQSVPGGTTQTAFFRSPVMVEFLNQWSGLNLKPSGERGTYSYYTQPGDHLSLHRDVDSCEFVVITCLYSVGNRDESSGALCLYPTRTQEPISAIRANPNLGVLPIHLSTGQSVVMRGGVIPHALLPQNTSQSRIVSILCYQLLL